MYNLYGVFQPAIPAGWMQHKIRADVSIVGRGAHIEIKGQDHIWNGQIMWKERKNKTESLGQL